MRLLPPVFRCDFFSLPLPPIKRVICFCPTGPLVDTPPRPQVCRPLFNCCASVQSQTNAFLLLDLHSLPRVLSWLQFSASPSGPSACRTLSPCMLSTSDCIRALPSGRPYCPCLALCSLHAPAFLPCSLACPAPSLPHAPATPGWAIVCRCWQNSKQTGLPHILACVQLQEGVASKVGLPSVRSGMA